MCISFVELPSKYCFYNSLAWVFYTMITHTPYSYIRRFEIFDCMCAFLSLCMIYIDETNQQIAR